MHTLALNQLGGYQNHAYGTRSGIWLIGNVLSKLESNNYRATHLTLYIWSTPEQNRVYGTLATVNGTMEPKELMRMLDSYSLNQREQSIYEETANLKKCQTVSGKGKMQEIKKILSISPNRTTYFLNTIKYQRLSSDVVLPHPMHAWHREKTVDLWSVYSKSLETRQQSWNSFSRQSLKNNRQDSAIHQKSTNSNGSNHRKNETRNTWGSFFFSSI